MCNKATLIASTIIVQCTQKNITAHCVRKALIQSPGPDLAPGTPPSALTDRDMPTIRAGFISNSASIMFPLHVGRYCARGIYEGPMLKSSIKPQNLHAFLPKNLHLVNNEKFIAYLLRSGETQSCPKQAQQATDT